MYSIITVFEENCLGEYYSPRELLIYVQQYQEVGTLTLTSIDLLEPDSSSAAVHFLDLITLLVPSSTKIILFSHALGLVVYNHDLIYKCVKRRNIQ